MMRIAVDAMGGDAAPVEIVKGSVDAFHSPSFYPRVNTSWWTIRSITGCVQELTFLLT